MTCTKSPRRNRPHHHCFFCSYRLAPEFVFPVPLDDCITATTFFLEHAKDYKVNPRRVAVAGKSDFLFYLILSIFPLSVLPLLPRGLSEHTVMCRRLSHCHFCLSSYLSGCTGVRTPDLLITKLKLYCLTTVSQTKEQYIISREGVGPDLLHVYFSGESVFTQC